VRIDPLDGWARALVGEDAARTFLAERKRIPAEDLSPAGIREPMKREA